MEGQATDSPAIMTCSAGSSTVLPCSKTPSPRNVALGDSQRFARMAARQLDSAQNSVFEQALPQVPQLWKSVVGSMQRTPQQVKPVGHAPSPPQRSRQIPPEHVRPAVHSVSDMQS